MCGSILKRFAFFKIKVTTFKQIKNTNKTKLSDVRSLNILYICIYYSKNEQLLKE